MSPEDKHFEVIRKLYEFDGFYVAWGKWFEDGKEQGEYIGMRWTRYPMNRAGKEAWLLVPEEVSKRILPALLGAEGTDKDELLKTLKEVF